MKNVLIVFGTRPEAIKMAPLVKEFQRYPQSYRTFVCVTGQHRQMLDQVLDVFDLCPDYDLNIMSPGQDLFDITSKVLLGMRDILKETQPDVVLVHGDTTTSMAVALASFYQQVKIGHVEAGLRTYNLQSPWPEEMNRQMTDRICDYYFAPTDQSRQNLLLERISSEKIFVTGNTVIDALNWVVRKINTDSRLHQQLQQQIIEAGYVNIDPTPFSSSTRAFCRTSLSPFILVTGHRRENFGDGFRQICKALKEIAFIHPEINIVYPVHLNPNVQMPVYELLNNIKNIYLIKPLDYLPFIFLLQKCYFVLTDSGGIQEEAPSLGKPVLVMRNTTERPEALEAGTVKLVGTDTDTIIEAVTSLIDDPQAYHHMVKMNNPYGDGKACERIVNVIIKSLG